MSRKKIWRIILISFLFLGFGVHSQADDKGLVGYWKFDEGAGDIAKDSSGKGNDGKIYGAKWVEDKVGKALSFDVKGYVDCGNDVSLDLTQDFTIELWVYFNNSNPQGLVWRGAMGSSGYLIYSAYGVLYLRTFSSEMKQIIANGGQVPGEWSHLVFVKEGKTGHIYKNRLEITTSADTLVNPVSNSEHLYIGCAVNTATYNINGIVGEVRTYNRALSAKEVGEHFMKYSGITEETTKETGEGLAGCWHFDEGKGDIVQDSSGKGNHGTIHGAKRVEEGKVGKCLLFDGEKSYVDCGKDASLSPGTGSFSVEFWMKISSPSDWYQLPVCAGLGVPAGYHFMVWTSGSNEAGKMTGINISDGKINNTSAWSKESVVDDKWRHVVGIIDREGVLGKANRSHMFIDGIEMGSGGGADISNLGEIVNSDVFKIGWGVYGLVDEVKVYKKVLTTDEIRTHYALGKMGKK